VSRQRTDPDARGSSNCATSVGSGYGLPKNVASASPINEVMQPATGLSGDFDWTIRSSVSSGTRVINVGFIFNGLGFGWE
jgi:hypothetical protein